MKKFLTSALIIITSVLSAQTASEEAAKYCARAKELADSLRLDEAAKQYELAVKIDPIRTLNYKYDMAKMFFDHAKYKKSAAELKKIYKRNDLESKHYHLYGKSLDMLGSYDKAYTVFQDANKKWPQSGLFFFEMGMMKLKMKEMQNAVTLWEFGVKAEALFASNYYGLGRLFGTTTERIWTLFYGEVLLNLTADTTEWKDMSIILFEAYQQGFNQGFVKANTVNVPVSDEAIRLPFYMIFERNIFKTADVILGDQKSLSIATLNAIRKQFITNWYAAKINKEFPINIVFDYQKQLIEEGHFEAYNYYIFKDAKPQEYQKWAEENPEKLEDFLDYWNGGGKMEVTAGLTFQRKEFMK